MQKLSIAPHSPPAKRKIDQALEALSKLDYFVFPCESFYLIGSTLSKASSAIKSFGKNIVVNQPLPFFFCRDITQVSKHACLDKIDFHLAQKKWPGPFVLYLDIRKGPPRKINPKRKKMGFVISEHPVLDAMVSQLDEPLLAFPLKVDNQKCLNLRDALGSLSKTPPLAIDCGELDDNSVWTVVDVIGGQPTVLEGEEFYA